MRGALSTPTDIQAGQRYRVYEGSQQIDELQFVFINDNRYGFAARHDYDELERIDLTKFLDDYNVVPANDVPVRSDSELRQPATRRLY